MNHRNDIIGVLAAMVTAAVLNHTIMMAAAEDTGVAYEFIASSYLGAASYDDSVVGARIQSDGTIVLAANLGPGAVQRIRGAGSAQLAGKKGCILRLSPDGKKLLSITGVTDEIKDMAIDDKDNIYLAAAGAGVIKMSPQADGHFAAIADKNIVIFDPTGKQIGSAKGSHYTNDVCVDRDSKTVVFCGFRNAHAFDGKRRYPVQICYVRGLDYSGERKWTNYEWSTDRDSDRFLNKPTNNMADTRADRCTIGRDGKLYVTFQVAGGNHIFRYSPKDIMQKVALAGGDKYHQFYNSRAEHKNVFIRYEPATGDFLAGQQFCGRLSSGRANAVVTKEGEINADEDGRVYVVGNSAYGIPMNLIPDESDYMGGGFVLVMSPDLKTRLLCTRTCGGKGAPHCVDARTIGGKLRTVYGGGRMPEAMFVKDALQAEAADAGDGKNDPKDGFFAVLEKN